MILRDVFKSPLYIGQWFLILMIRIRGVLWSSTSLCHYFDGWLSGDSQIINFYPLIVPKYEDNVLISERELRPKCRAFVKSVNCSVRANYNRYRDLSNLLMSQLLRYLSLSVLIGLLAKSFVLIAFFTWETWVKFGFLRDISSMLTDLVVFVLENVRLFLGMFIFRFLWWGFALWSVFVFSWFFSWVRAKGGWGVLVYSNRATFFLNEVRLSLEFRLIISNR